MASAIPSRTTMPAIPVATLGEHCGRVLRAAGLSGRDADLVAASLVDAEARGVASHGLQRLRIYVERLRAGLLDASAEPRIVHRTAAGALIDARNAIGHVGAAAGLALATELAAASGSGVCGVRNSNHCGTLAYFARSAAQDGFVIVAMSNAPATMTYYGGRSRAVGTNPLCIAAPNGDVPIVLDMASSATARGKIILAERRGEMIPSGWAVDVEGRPTTEPAKALDGAVVPFAGPKGSGLALLIDVLCGALLGGPTGLGIGDMYEDWTRPQQVGHVFLALAPGAWAGEGSFARAVGQMVQEVRAQPRAAGVDEVLLPGDVEQRAWERAAEDGVQVEPSVVSDLHALAKELGLPSQLGELPRDDVGPDSDTRRSAP